MAVKLTSTVTEKFYAHDLDDSGETWVEIIHLKPGKLAEIEDKCNPVKRTFKDGEDSELEVEIGLLQSKRLRTVACIKAWKGFEDEEGNPLECNETTILQVINELGEPFYAFIDKSRKTLATKVNKEKEPEKNS